MTSAKRPLIGISGRRLLAGMIAGAPASMADAEIDVHFCEYADRVADAGGIPVQLTRSAEPAAVLDRLDGVLLSGGDDVDPRLYGSGPGPSQGSFEPARDRFEAELVDGVMEAGMPVLGICRGIQLINVALGGTLVGHLAPDAGEGHSCFAYPRAERTHAISIIPGTVLASLYGESAVVNSFHHQAVDRPGDGLIVSALAPDGVVEAIEHRVLPIIGVQWHPEMLTEVEHEKIRTACQEMHEDELRHANELESLLALL